MIYFCCDETRRRALLEGTSLNGIDFVEVEDDPSMPPDQRQKRLFVHFVKPLLPATFIRDNFRINGGERIRNIVIKSISSGADASIPFDPREVVLELDAPGDFSVYTLQLVRGSGANAGDPPDGFDPLLSSIDFEFKAACESDFDCQPLCTCFPARLTAPALDHLAKDYSSLRQMMLDRMAVLVPDWTERHAADLGIMLVELLAYVGDFLSYEQDAIATEAYLGTARRRTSVRRHARLVDYAMHDGVNARVWVKLDVALPFTLQKQDTVGTTQFLTRFTTTAGSGIPTVFNRGSASYADAVNGHAIAFEPVEDGTPLRPEHNEMRFHTWSARECCLPKGTTQADLRGAFPQLQDAVLIFVEVLGPETGLARDADPNRRCAVRVTNVRTLNDPVEGVDVTRIEWSEDDALPFPVCVSSQAIHGPVDDVSVAWGNIVLADHGRSVTAANFATVPLPNAALTVHAEGCFCDHTPPDPTPARFNPKLPELPLTFAAPYLKNTAAARSLESSPADLVPSITLSEQPAGRKWSPRETLLDANGTDTLFVAECEADGTARLRFGDGIAGAQPPAEARFSACYRIGNGRSGNIGAESLVCVVSNDPAAGAIITVRNPMAARGGIDPETIEHVRQSAPYAFRTQERAVTPDDYAAVAQRCSTRVQRAAATFVWTGSWYTVFVSVDPKGGQTVAGGLATTLVSCIDRYRMAGVDLDVGDAEPVPLELVLSVCVKRGYFTSDVERAIREVLSNGVRRDGTLGFFHPDNLTFGQTVYLSSIVGAVQAVEGVDSVEVVTFQRQGQPATSGIASGKIELGRLEIARLDNDPDFRERGVLSLQMGGGR